jgi:hypothetical protein
MLDWRTGKPVREAEWLLTISPEKPCLLKVGAPFRPKVVVWREGRKVYLSYQLLDVEGRQYVDQKREKPPPRFTLSAGDRQLASGSFKYG